MNSLVTEMVERAEREFLPSVGKNLKSYCENQLEFTKRRINYLLPLENYLSSQERWASFTDGNPTFFSALSPEESCRILEKRFMIQKARDRRERDYFAIYSNKECDPDGYIYNAGLETEDKGTLSYLETRLYEYVFGLSEGTFKMRFQGHFWLRVDGESRLQDYWNYLLDNDTPFLLKELGKLGENGGLHQNLGETYLINGIDIFE